MNKCWISYASNQGGRYNRKGEFVFKRPPKQSMSFLRLVSLNMGFCGDELISVPVLRPTLRGEQTVSTLLSKKALITTES
jgi:hypothetical protein